MSVPWQPPVDDDFVPPSDDEVLDQSQGQVSGSGLPIPLAALSKTWDMAGQANTFLKDKIGGGIAEGGGYLGGKLEAAGYPTLGKVAQAQGIVSGFGLSMLPEAVTTAASLRGLYGIKNPTVQGLLNTPQELGTQYAAQNKAIGVVRGTTPEGGRLPTYPQPEIQGFGARQPRPLPGGAPSYLPEVVPERLPSKPGDFLKYGDEKLTQFGTRMNPQELMDWDVKLQTDMANPNIIPRFKPDGGTTTIYQEATDLSARAKSTFNQIAEERLKAAKLPEGVMPTRASLDQAYAVASRVQEFTRRGLGLAWKVGKSGAKWAAAGVVGGAFGYGTYRSMR